MRGVRGSLRPVGVRGSSAHVLEGPVDPRVLYGDCDMTSQDLTLRCCGLVAAMGLYASAHGNAPPGSGSGSGAGADDPCPSCLGDVVPDGVVEFSDLAAVVAGFGTFNPWLDVDQSGSVDTNDILSVCRYWGPCP